MIDALRQSLQKMQKPAGIDGAAPPLPLGVPVIDAVLGGGLARGALHEIAAAGEVHVATAAGFALGLTCLQTGADVPSPRLRGEGGECRRHKPGEGAFRQAQIRCETPSPARLRCASAAHLSPHAGRGGRSLVWIAEDMALAESGAPYGPGLDALGLHPEKLLTVAAAHARDLMWAMEEALRCRAVAAVIGELRHGEIDAVAARRLSLAANTSGALALLLRASPPHDASTAATRWIVSAAPHDSFTVRLTRNRRGPLGAWTLQWSNDDERFILATHAQPVAAQAGDRPHQKVA